MKLRNFIANHLCARFPFVILLFDINAFREGAYPIMVWNDPRKNNVLLRSSGTKSLRYRS